MEAMLVGRTGTQDTSVSTIDVPAIGPVAESFAAVINSLEAANGANTVTPSQSHHLAAKPGAQDSMAMMDWLNRLPFKRKQGRASTRREPLDTELLHGLARWLVDGKDDSPKVREAMEKVAREILGGETESEFSALMSPVGHIASKVEHAVAGFGKTTGHYVASHAEEIGLSAGAAAVVGGIAAGAADVVGGLGAVAALF
jgi:hypothetical protein